MKYNGNEKLNVYVITFMDQKVPDTPRRYTPPKG